MKIQITLRIEFAQSALPNAMRTRRRPRADTRWALVLKPYFAKQARDSRNSSQCQTAPGAVLAGQRSRAEALQPDSMARFMGYRGRCATRIWASDPRSDTPRPTQVGLKLDDLDWDRIK